MLAIRLIWDAILLTGCGRGDIILHLCCKVWHLDSFLNLGGEARKYSVIVNLENEEDANFHFNHSFALVGKRHFHEFYYLTFGQVLPLFQWPY